MRLFARKLTAATKENIYLCLELILYEMSSTLISFDREYYNYHGGENNEQGLAIGGYELVLNSKPVASYLFEKATTLLNRTTYHGIYQYDGLVAFKGKKSVQGINNWLL